MNSTTHEEWRPIAGYEGLYEVSSHGRVRSLDRKVEHKNGTVRILKGRVLKPSTTRDGYKVVVLCKEGKCKNHRVHRLVLEAFTVPCPQGMEGRHLDSAPANNHVDNLKWGTSSENNQDILKARHHHMVNRTHCPRNHLLKGNNLVPSKLKKGVRSCRACDRASAYCRKHPELALQTESDRYYAAILAG